MNIKAYTLNAFSKSSDGGNPAGVVLEADILTDEQMQKITYKIGLAETAFIQISNKADFKLKFFTPNQEVDLCGHATIASFYLLKNLQLIQTGKYSQETKSGILNIDIKDDAIFMDQNLPKFLDKIDKKIVAEALGVLEDKIIPDLPIQIVSTGFPTIIVPITTLNALNSLSPVLNKCVDLCQKKFLLHPFTLETINDKSIAHSRNFFPVKTLDEEAATGTATGSLSCYLYKYGKIDEKQTQNLNFEQGYILNRPSEILASLKIANQHIAEVKIGGTASNIKKININI